MSKVEILFNEDEKRILNNIAEGVTLTECMKQLSFTHQTSSDADVRRIFFDLSGKLNSIGEMGWKQVQNSLPFTVSVADEDLDIPENADVEIEV